MSKIVYLEPWESHIKADKYALLVLQRKYRTRDNPQYIVIRNKGIYHDLWPGAVINMDTLRMYIADHFEEFL